MAYIGFLIVYILVFSFPESAFFDRSADGKKSVAKDWWRSSSDFGEALSADGPCHGRTLPIALLELLSSLAISQIATVLTASRPSRTRRPAASEKASGTVLVAAVRDTDSQTI